MKLQEISWPVYKLKDTRPEELDGVLFYTFWNQEGQIVQIVDDKNLPAESLAGRRLKLMIDGVKLYRPKFSLYFLGDLIKVAKPQTWFIDSSGKLFQYTKEHYVPLKFLRITNVLRSVGCVLVEVEGHQARFKALFPPRLGEKYAGVLSLGKNLLLYGFYEAKFKDTRRKI